jgi:hypothetical protein
MCTGSITRTHPQPLPPPPPPACPDLYVDDASEGGEERGQAVWDGTWVFPRWSARVSRGFGA